MKTVIWICLLILLCMIAAYVLLQVIASLAVKPGKEYNHNSRFYRFLMNSIAGFSIWVSRVHVEITGKELVPEHQRFLYVCNHRSKYDPIIAWFFLRKQNIAFLSKAENFEIPIFGRTIRKCCFLMIDREDPGKAIETFHKASELMKQDEVSIGIYPEGTRSKDGSLLPFHNGIFRVAKDAEAPIVVAAMRGTEQIHKNWPYHRTTVYFDIIEVIPASFVKENRTPTIGKRVREDIERQLNQECMEGEI